MTKKNSVVVGHNRWASTGRKNSISAHPFQIGNITGVHNGTLKQQYRLPDSNDYAVDSENIIHSIDKIGIEETWKLTVGPAALVWYDNGDSQLKMIRNEERPMFFSYSKDLKQMYFGSELHMLRAALWRNGISTHKIEELPVNKLYSFKVDIWAQDPKEVVKCTVKDLEPAPASFQETQSTSYLNHHQKGKSKAGSVDKSSSSVYFQLGNRVDFMVMKVVVGKNSTKYTCVDNNTDDLYEIIDHYNSITLHDWDCRTAIVTSAYNNVGTLAIHTIKDDSAFVLSTEAEENLPAVTAPNEDTKVTKDENEWDSICVEEVEINGISYQFNKNGECVGTSNDSISTAEKDKVEQAAVWQEELENEWAESKKNEIVEWSEATKDETRLEKFEKLKHQDCSWCGSPVDAGEEWISDSEGGCICGVCKDEKDVALYLGLDVAQAY